MLIDIRQPGWVGCALAFFALSNVQLVCQCWLFVVKGNGVVMDVAIKAKGSGGGIIEQERTNIGFAERSL